MIEVYILIGITLFFIALGLIGLFLPRKIALYFGASHINKDQLNELRSVYGGLPCGVAFIGASALANISPLTIAQVMFVYAVLLLAMVTGRLFAIFVERPTKRSYAFLIIELLLGGMALYAFNL